jgi:endonuclease/exonuclease/phosphatase family metal-dependent hydrolase
MLEEIKMENIRIMSHNLWKHDKNSPAWEEMGMSCSARTRAPGFVRVYSEIRPDIIGMQESSDVMLDYIMGGLAENGIRYGVLWGKDTPILYRQDRFDVIDQDYFLYPDEFPGHEGVFNNGRTKSWCIGVFREKETGKVFAFMTTHIWWMSNNPESKSYHPFSDEAREYQISLAVKKLGEISAKYNCPAILVGDMNAAYTSLALKHAMKNGMLHAHDIATDYVDETRGVHCCNPNNFGNCYYEGGFAMAIDHVLVTEGFDVKRFERYSPEYYLPLSDHSPVFVDLTVK